MNCFRWRFLYFVCLLSSILLSSFIPFWDSFSFLADISGPKGLHADDIDFSALKSVPITWKGRVRPFDAYSRLWLHEKMPDLDKSQQPAYAQVWLLHFLGKSKENGLLLLPGRNGEWFSIDILKSDQISNFTIYSDPVFIQIRQSYLAAKEAFAKEDDTKVSQEIKGLAAALHQGYGSIAGMPMLEAAGKKLLYPTYRQLELESFYYDYPLIPLTIAIYALAALLLVLKSLTKSRLAIIVLVIAFCAHTGILLMRWIIVARPPVSNMFETVIYVPWVALLTSLVLRFFNKSNKLLLAASLASLLPLILLQTTSLSRDMETVQAVLDSQYWLIVHVLMVVGSYGVFLLGALLGHLYLMMRMRTNPSPEKMAPLAKTILQTIYIGTALLICGTLLGGAWAAQSWGRFWDWDPKESWAFISSCIYLIIIHASSFRYIGHLGIAIGAVLGFQAVLFTWYGVNYILGTGLHSYGFGSGGDFYYYLFVAAEAIFLGTCFFRSKKQQITLPQ